MSRLVVSCRVFFPFLSVSRPLEWCRSPLSVAILVALLWWFLCPPVLGREARAMSMCWIVWRVLFLCVRVCVCVLIFSWLRWGVWCVQSLGPCSALDLHRWLCDRFMPPTTRVFRWDDPHQVEVCVVNILHRVFCLGPSFSLVAFVATKKCA